MSDLPAVFWVLVLAGVLGFLVTTGVVLHRGAVAAGLPRRTAVTVSLTAVLIWAGWVAASAALTASGAFRQAPDSLRPWFGLAVVIPMSVALAATRIPVMARILDAPGTFGRLALPQVFRVVGGMFLVVLLMGELPAVFALPAGLGDMAIGIAAPFVARRTGRSVWFHVLGLLDLVVALGTGFLAGLGPDRLLPVTPSTLVVTLLPLALIPTAGVPLAAALHVTALTKLRTAVPVG